MLGQLVDALQHLVEVRQVVVAAVRLRLPTQQVGPGARDVTAGADPAAASEPGFRQVSHAASRCQLAGQRPACTTVSRETARVSTT